MDSPITEAAAKTPRRRQRSTRSCQECRRRKVKCDRKQPCSHCVLSKTSCIHVTDPIQAAAPFVGSNNAQTSLVASHTTPSLVYERQGLGIFQQTEPKSTSIRVSPRGGDGNRITSSSTRFSPFASNENPELNELNRRVQLLEQELSSYRSNGTPPDAGPTSTAGLKDGSHLHHDRRVMLNKSRLFGQSHWSNAAHEFRKIGAFLSSDTGNSKDGEVTKRLKLEIHALLQKCKFLAKGMKTSRPSRSFSRPELTLPTTTKDFADQMARLYISRFESAFRILHVPSFWSEYQQYWQSPTEAPSALQFKVQLVIAIGSSLYRESSKPANIHSIACQWVHAAQNWLSGPMEKDRLDISGLQVQCLLILARQTLSVGGDLIWIAMGTLIRTAMQMGLHHDPKHFMKMTVLQGEIRRRIWATILEMNVQASLDSGVPPALSFDDFDTDPPSNVDDKDIDDCTGALEQGPKTTVTDTSLQRFLLGCLRPRVKILQRMNGVCSEISHDEVLALTSEINNACRECGAHVKKSKGTGGEIFRHNLADLFLRRFLLNLHRPFVSQARTNPAFYFSRKISVDSATALLSPTPDDEFSHLVLIGSGMFKNRIIFVSLALSSELLIEIEEQGVGSSMQGLSSYKKMLVDAVKEARSQLSQRIQLGETNVRLYMKLSIVLSQAESTEVGTALQQQMAQSARDSLQVAYSMIQAHSGSPASWLHGSENIPELQEADQQDISNGFDFNDILQTTDFVMDDAFGLNPPFC